ELQLPAINALQDRHRDRQLVNAMHREMLVAVQVRRFARLKELGRDADAPIRRGSNLFELSWQARERERGGESNSDKKMSHPGWTLAGNYVFNNGQSLLWIELLAALLVLIRSSPDSTHRYLAVWKARPRLCLRYGPSILLLPGRSIETHSLPGARSLLPSQLCL